MSAGELFSTRLVPPQRRQLFWRELVAETFPGMVADVPEGIKATLARWSLGRIGLAHAISGRAHISRSAIADRDRNLVFHFQRHGSLTMTHNDEIITACNGAVVIADDSRPYALDISAQNDCLILQIPDIMLGEKFASGSWHGKLLCPEDPHVGIFRRLIEGLWHERGMLDQVDQEFDGIVAAAARITCTRAGGEGVQHNINTSPMEYALRNLADPELATARISQATGLSPRAVQKAFIRHTGMTPTAFITERRLQRALELLERGDDRSITDVAFEVGFNDSAFFSRCFRRRFGEAPRQWRGRADFVASEYGARAPIGFASVQ